MNALIENLKAEFDASRPEPERIKQLMSDYISAGHEDYKDYMFFNQHKYARNLVEMNKHFELIVLCWESHQESPIHNHSVRFPVSSQIPFSCSWQFTLPDQGIDPPTLPLGQNCWMAVLDGPMKEVYYHAEPDSEDRVQLTEGEAQIYHTGQVAYIADEIALHKVSPGGDGRGATLHLYSKPIPGCQIYDPISGKITKRIMGFFSKKGKKLDSTESSCQIYRDLAKDMCPTSCDRSYLKLLDDACGGGQNGASAEKPSVSAN